MTPWITAAWALGGVLPALGIMLGLSVLARRWPSAPVVDVWPKAPVRDTAPDIRINDDGAIHMMFDAGDLLDASAAGHAALADERQAGDGPCDLQAARRALDRRIPGAAAALAAPLPSDGLVIRHADSRGNLVLRARTLHGLTRISLTEAAPDDDSITLPRDSHAAAQQELRFLRSVTDLDPSPVWAEGPDGAIQWANAAYLDLCPDKARTWPPVALFPAPDPPTPPNPLESEPKPQRQAIKDLQGGTHHYDIHRHPHADCTIAHAIPCSDRVRAEGSLQAITQTLTKTFAQLPTGLAIFDTDRRLILFNPVLADLTTLDPGWLTGRPELSAFLDRLRDRQMIPEPRDYRTWRKSLIEAPGSYAADWSLPNGQTYRVTFRADDDGALAMVLQDISQEMATIRGFRADLETHEAVLDLCGEAIAVFSRNGTLIVANPSYGALWNVPPVSGLQESTILDATRLWSMHCEASPVWGEIRDFVASFAERWAWSGSLRHQQGFDVKLRVAPLPGGATLVGFQWASDILLDHPPLAPESAEAPAQRRAH